VIHATKIGGQDRPARTYGVRACARCERPMSTYNPNEVCASCAEKMACPDAYRLYDTRGWPMSLRPVEVRILAVLSLYPCQHLPLSSIIFDLPETTLQRALQRLARKGWIFDSKRGLGCALIGEPISERRRV